MKELIIKIFGYILGTIYFVVVWAMENEAAFILYVIALIIAICAIRRAFEGDYFDLVAGLGVAALTAYTARKLARKDDNYLDKYFD